MTDEEEKQFHDLGNLATKYQSRMMMAEREIKRLRSGILCAQWTTVRDDILKVLEQTLNGFTFTPPAELTNYSEWEVEPPRV